MNDISNKKVAISSCEKNGRNGEKSVRYYTASTSHAGEINAAERNGVGEADWARKNERMGRTAWHCNEIKTFLGGKNLPENLWLFRGTSLPNFCDAVFENVNERFDFLRDCRNFNDKELTEAWRGKIITYRQFVSTSRKYEVAKNDFASRYSEGCVLEIFAPEGTNGADISKYSKYQEEEILLASYLKMRIDSIGTNEKGQKYIRLSVMGK